MRKRRTPVNSSGMAKLHSCADFGRVLAVTLPMADASENPTRTLAAGFRQSMFTLSADDGTVARVDSGGGCGNDYITLLWHENGDPDGKPFSAVVTGRDLLLAFVEQVDPASADQLRREFFGTKEEALTPSGAIHVLAEKL